MKLYWSLHPIEGFEDAREHTEFPWPCKLLDADGNECLLGRDETDKDHRGKETPEGMVLVPGIRVDTETGEVWYHKANDNGQGQRVEGYKKYKAPLTLVAIS